MINERAGVRVEIDGRSFVRTQPGLMGHAIYGPYETLEPGTYSVEFPIAPLSEPADGRDPLLALVDVVAGPQVRLAEGLVFRSRLGHDGRYVIGFETDKRLSNVEYRLYVNGVEPLLLGDPPVVTRASRLRTPPQRALPGFLREHLGRFGGLFAAGVGLAVLGDDVIATACGFSFFTRTADDLNFVDEVLLKGAYNILTPSPACVVDIGMNIGLTSLRLASSPNVREVHAFEPFPTTFARAAANVALNPPQQAKITLHDFGLFDCETEVTTRVADSSDSGSYSVFGPERGEPVTIRLRDAAATLRPIFDAAQASGLLVVLKVDCEGSEFAVFRSLQAGGLIRCVAAYMVEYHRGYGAAGELTSRLTEAGFVVFDLGYAGDNGFFYAVRLGGDTP